MIWLDCLRLCAGLSMLGLHCTADPTGQPWVDYPPAERVAPLLLRAVLYSARTELFLIISVFLLMLALDRRPRSYRTVIAQQADRLLLPFLFWTLFYAAYNCIKAAEFGYLPQYLSQLSDPTSWLRFLVLGQVKYHMHFLPTLFALILMFPLFKAAQRYPLLGLSIIACLLARHALDSQLYANYWGHNALPFLIRLIKILTYAGYGMFAGAAWGLIQGLAPSQRHRLFAPILGLAVLFFTFKLLATWQTIQTGSWPYDNMPGYWADYLMPVLLFALGASCAELNWSSSLAKMAQYAFGLYLCHPIFIDISEIILRPHDLSPFAQVGLKIAITLPATAVLVRALAHSKALAWTIGLAERPGKMAKMARVQIPERGAQ